MVRTSLWASSAIFLSIAIPGIVNATCLDDAPLTIVSSTDDGLYEETHGPENAIDGSLDPDSRWSNLGQGEPKYLMFDLGAVQTVKSLGIAWYKGDQRKASYAIEASSDGDTFQNLRPLGMSAGASLDFEINRFDPVQAQYLHIAAEGNEANEWNSVVEVQVTGCGTQVAAPIEPVLTPRANTGLYGLDPSKSPGENFDLLSWYMTTPADDNGDGKADSVYENELAAGWTDERYFYTDPVTGGMVFRVTPAGAKTSKNTQYTRTELRQMLRRGDYSIQTREADESPNKNNWVFSSAPLKSRFNSGGVDGVMRATLAVNQVTRMGLNSQIGRVVIGQIHAKNDEPIRLYYRKLPGNKNGSIYFVHDPEVGKERGINVIGNRSDRAKSPIDGIGLDEIFSYEIRVEGKREGDVTVPYLYVKIIREDGTRPIFTNDFHIKVRNRDIPFPFPFNADFIAKNFVQTDAINRAFGAIRTIANHIDATFFSHLWVMYKINRTIFVPWQFAIIQTDGFIILGVNLPYNNTSNLGIQTHTCYLVDRQRCPHHAVNTA